MKILSTILFLFLSFGQALAAQTPAKSNSEPDLLEYDVEIILFEDAHARYINSQTWNTNINSSDASLAIEDDTETPVKLSASANNTPVFTNIKPAILSKAYHGLKVSSEYKILFYGAWRQTGLDEKKAFEININDLENRHKVSSKNTLSGTFKLVLARYLHIYNQLNYTRKANISESTGLNEQQTETISTGFAHNTETYPLNSHRRMRSKELHYIDHPLVGMLIQINPVKKPEE